MSTFAKAWKIFRSRGGTSPSVDKDLWKNSLAQARGVGDFIEDGVGDSVSGNMQDVVSEAVEEFFNNPAVLEYALENPGIPLFEGKGEEKRLRPATVKMFDKIFSKGSVPLSYLATALTAAGHNFKAGEYTDKEGNIRRYARQGRGSVQISTLKKALSEYISKNKLTNLNDPKAANAMSSTGTYRVRKPEHYLKRRERMLDLMRSGIIPSKKGTKKEWKEGAKEAWIKKIKERAEMRRGLFKSKSKEHPTPEDYTSELRPSMSYSELLKYRRSLKKGAGKKQTQKKSSKKPKAVKYYIENYIDTDVGREIYATNPFVDTVAELVSNFGVSIGSIYGFGLLEKIINKIPLFKNKPEWKATFNKTSVMVIAYALSKTIEIFADRRMYGRAKIVTEDVAKTIRVVGAIYGFATLPFVKKMISNMAGTGTSTSTGALITPIEFNYTEVKDDVSEGDILAIVEEPEDVSPVVEGIVTNNDTEIVSYE